MKGHTAFDLQQQSQLVKAVAAMQSVLLDSLLSNRRPVFAGAAGHHPGAQGAGVPADEDMVMAASKPAGGAGDDPSGDEGARYCSSYGGRRRPVAIILTVAAHVLLFAGLLTLSHEYSDTNKPASLVAFDLTEPPPPPPPPPPKLEIVKELPIPKQVVVKSPVVVPEKELDLPSENKITASQEGVEKEQPVSDVPSGSTEGKADKAEAIPDRDVSIVRAPSPTYPRLSRNAKETGVVSVKVLVGSDGRAKAVELQKSSGFERLDKAALSAVRKWRFNPRISGGRSVEAWITLPVTFTLNS